MKEKYIIVEIIDIILCFPVIVYVLFISCKDKIKERCWGSEVNDEIL